MRAANPDHHFKPRLQRLQWLYTQHPIYFVTFSTEPRRAILDNASTHQAFIRFAGRAPSYGVHPGYYVLMPDHVHLFAAFASNAVSLSTWMKSLKNSLSKALRASQTAAPHWEKDFFDHVLRSKESYEQKVAYVRQNPVRAGLVQRAEDWPYQGHIFNLAFIKEKL
ncbi:MAG TPA: transposase [Terriglobia bacterium]|nr:transposase [Terriglobia bacterium]